MDAREWDARYAGAELVWSAGPNMFVEELLADVEPGVAVDVAAGEGRNALWLAAHGWQVTAVDFSEVGMRRARTLASQHEDPGVAARLRTVVADVTQPYEAPLADAVIVCYLQIVPEAWAAALAEAASHVAPGGRLYVIGHDRRNLAEGVGGPQSTEVLQDPDEIAESLRARGFAIEQAGTRERPVAGADRPALDTVVVARSTLSPTA